MELLWMSMEFGLGGGNLRVKMDLIVESSFSLNLHSHKSPRFPGPDKSESP